MCRAPWQRGLQPHGRAGLHLEEERGGGVDGAQRAHCGRRDLVCRAGDGVRNLETLRDGRLRRIEGLRRERQLPTRDRVDPVTVGAEQVEDGEEQQEDVARSKG